MSLSLRLREIDRWMVPLRSLLFFWRLFKYETPIKIGFQNEIENNMKPLSNLIFKTKLKINFDRGFISKNDVKKEWAYKETRRRKRGKPPRQKTRTHTKHNCQTSASPIPTILFACLSIDLTSFPKIATQPQNSNNNAGLFFSSTIIPTSPRNRIYFNTFETFGA